ncbi:MAG: BatA domain-containing protein [Caulobacteraceae bacterium]|nr:BatA domain-containing protein [Caulobacteraceae bacterium]
MTPALLLPAGLFALAALAIPLVLHIARRTESRTVEFAALRWLEARPKPRRSLRLEELILLVVRLLLLALIALWLARPVLWDVQDGRRIVALLPGVDSPPAGDDDERRVWLAPGFPAVGGPVPAVPANPVSLIRQLDAELPPSTPVTVVVPSVLDGVDAERPRLSRSLDWQVAGPAPAAPAPTRRSPPALTVRHAPGDEAGVRYFRAAATAWAAADTEPAFESGPADQRIPRDTTRLVWLAPGPVPAPVVGWIRNGGTALMALEARAPVEGETQVVWADTTGEPLAVAGRLGAGRVIRLTRPLEPASLPLLVEPEFPDALAQMLSPMPPPARVASAALAPLTGAAPYDQPPLDLRPWLALIIALLFAGERILATRRARAVAP